MSPLCCRIGGTFRCCSMLNRSKKLSVCFQAYLAKPHPMSWRIRCRSKKIMEEPRSKIKVLWVVTLKNRDLARFFRVMVKYHSHTYPLGVMFWITFHFSNKCVHFIYPPSLPQASQQLPPRQDEATKMTDVAVANKPGQDIGVSWLEVAYYKC